MSRSITFQNTIEEDSNPYALSTLNPFDAEPVHIPDLDMNTSFIKSVTINSSLLAIKDSFMIVSRPSSSYENLTLLSQSTNPTPLATIFAGDNVFTPQTVNESGFIRIQSLPLDEDLSENYVWGRLVSSGVKMRSSTISAGNFTLSGTINAADYQNQPDFRTLRFETIPSFKRSNADVVTQTSVADGVCTLSRPFGGQEFRTLETGQVYSSASNAVIVLEEGDPSPYWFYRPVNAVVPVGQTRTAAYYSKANGALPQGIRGRIKWCLTMHTPPTTDTDMRIRFFFPGLSTTDWDTPILGGTGYYREALVLRSSNTNTSSYAHTCTEFLPNELQAVQITFTSSAQQGSVNAPTSVRFFIECPQLYEKGFSGPGTMVGFSGMNPAAAQTITLSGKYNYEVVPNSDLARQITTSSSRTPENPFLIKALEYSVAKGDMKFLWTNSDYEARVRSGSIYGPANINRQMQSAGFYDFLKGVARVATPVVGGLATSFFGPEAGTMVTKVGDALSSDGTYRYQAGGTYRYSPGSGTIGAIPRRRANMAYVGTMLQEIARTKILSDEVVDSPGGILDLANLDVLNPLTGDTKSMMVSVTQRGIVAQVAFDVVANRFAIVEKIGDTKRAAFGAIWFSTVAPPQYRNVSVQLPGGDQVDLKISCPHPLSRDSVYALACANRAAGYPDGYTVIKTQIEESIELSGPSLGLAAFFCYRTLYYQGVVSGFIDEDMEVVAISEIPAKAELAASNNLCLLTPYDEAIDDELGMVHLPPHMGVVPVASARFGDLYPDTAVPGLVLVSNVSELILAAVLLNNNVSKGKMPSTRLREVNTRNYEVEATINGKKTIVKGMKVVVDREVTYSQDEYDDLVGMARARMEDLSYFGYPSVETVRKVLKEEPHQRGFNVLKSMKEFLTSSDQHHADNRLKTPTWVGVARQTFKDQASAQKWLDDYNGNNADVNRLKDDIYTIRFRGNAVARLQGIAAPKTKASILPKAQVIRGVKTLAQVQRSLVEEPARKSKAPQPSQPQQLPVQFSPPTTFEETLSSMPQDEDESEEEYEPAPRRRKAEEEEEEPEPEKPSAQPANDLTSLLIQFMADTKAKQEATDATLKQLISQKKPGIAPMKKRD